MDKIITQAKSDIQKIVLPEAIYENRTIAAGAILKREGIVEPVFLGEEAKIRNMLKDTDICIDGIEILAKMFSFKLEQTNMAKKL